MPVHTATDREHPALHPGDASQVRLDHVCGKATRCMIPTMWPPGKGGAMETQADRGSMAQRDERLEHRGFLEQRNSSVRHLNSGQLSLYICPNP